MAQPAPERTRRENLAQLVELVHRDGPTSRAELALRLGLNRSTIAAQVGALVAAGLVVETAPGSSGRVGRPSPVVGPAPDIAILAVNPEVDALTVALVGFGGRVLRRERLPPATAPHEVAEAVALALDRLALAGGLLLGVGIAVPGLVRRDGVVSWAPRLGWRDADVGAVVADATGLRVVVDNDARLGARAEHLFGAGRGVDDLVYVNGGPSGIGGGIIAGGRLLRGATGFAGEFGHNRVDGGELERTMTRDALLAHAGLSVDSDEDALATALAAPGAGPLGAELARQRRVLAVAIANAVNVLDPEVVVLGGFLAALLDDGLRALVSASAIEAPDTGVGLRAAALGRDRLLIGAAEAALDAFFDDPLTTAAQARPLGTRT